MVIDFGNVLYEVDYRRRGLLIAGSRAEEMLRRFVGGKRKSHDERTPCYGERVFLDNIQASAEPVAAMGKAGNAFRGPQT